MTVGMPIMKLDRQAHVQGQRAGNVQAVCREAMEERAGSDPDINRELTAQNVYYGDYKSGEELADWYEQMAADYKITDKNGKERTLRSDAGVAFTGIVKPLSDDFGGYSKDKQKKFLEDSLEIVRDIFSKRGMEIDQGVIHMDEGCPHLHYFGHDADYKLGRKLGLPLFDVLNREYPKKMREKGWKVDGLTGWKEETEGMTAEEKEEYKKKRPKKKHGRSSKEYKAEKRVKELEAKVAALEAKNAELEEQTEGFPFKVVWSKAEKRRDKAEEDAKAAEARQKAAEDAAAKAIEKQAEAEKAAQEAAQKAQEAREAEEKARDALTDLKAQAGDIRRSVSDAVTDAEKVREYMDKVSRTPVRASDAAIIKYLKANKDGAGKSLYEIFQERATEAQRRTAGKHSAKVDSVVKSARKRALPDISQIQQPQSDDEFSL